MSRYPLADPQWWAAASIRAIKTIAQTMLGVLGASAVLSDVSWSLVASAGALAGITSLLTSLGGLPELDAATMRIARAGNRAPDRHEYRGRATEDDWDD